MLAPQSRYESRNKGGGDMLPPPVRFRARFCGALRIDPFSFASEEPLWRGPCLIPSVSKFALRPPVNPASSGSVCQRKTETKSRHIYTAQIRKDFLQLPD